MDFALSCWGYFWSPEAKSYIPIVHKIENRFVLLKYFGPLNGNCEEKEGTACSPATFFPLIHMDSRQESNSEPLKQ